MNLEEIFDNEGQDGEENKKAFDRLPKILQYFITVQQKAITESVQRAAERQFGIVGLGGLVKTSGFRSRSTNERYNGKPDSLHLYGLAADFAKTGVYKDRFLKLCSNFTVIDSGDCWHVQFKRG